MILIAYCFEQNMKAFACSFLLFYIYIENSLSFIGYYLSKIPLAFSWNEDVIMIKTLSKDYEFKTSTKIEFLEKQNIINICLEKPIKFKLPKNMNSDDIAFFRHLERDISNR